MLWETVSSSKLEFRTLPGSRYSEQPIESFTFYFWPYLIIIADFIFLHIYWMNNQIPNRHFKDIEKSVPYDIKIGTILTLVFWHCRERWTKTS
jgi:hypothetical protein